MFHESLRNLSERVIYTPTGCFKREYTACPGPAVPPFQGTVAVRFQQGPGFLQPGPCTHVSIKPAGRAKGSAPLELLRFPRNHDRGERSRRDEVTVKVRERNRLKTLFS